MTYEDPPGLGPTRNFFEIKPSRMAKNASLSATNSIYYIGQNIPFKE